MSTARREAVLKTEPGVVVVRQKKGHYRKRHTCAVVKTPWNVAGSLEKEPQSKALIVIALGLEKSRECRVKSKELFNR